MDADEEALRLALGMCTIAAAVAVVLVPCLLQTAHWDLAVLTTWQQKTSMPL